MAHALGRTDGSPGRWPMPARGDNQRVAGVEVPTPGGGGGGGRARRPAAAARAKLRSVASAAARRDAAANATRVAAGGGGGGTRAPPAGGRKGLLLPLSGRDRRHVVQVRQHRLGLGA